MKSKFMNILIPLSYTVINLIIQLSVYLPDKQIVKIYMYV